MKSVWSFILLAPLFGMSYCSIVSNVVSQPLPISKPDLASLAKQQMKRFRTNEPFVAYNKLENGTLELFGTAFGDYVTQDKISFLQKVTSDFDIHSVVFKWFYFDEKILKIFDVFHKKLRKSVKSVTFEKCYFPEGLAFESSLELKHVTKCFFINCFSNEESFKAIFMIFKKESVTSLTISRVFDYKQRKSIDTNIGLQSMVIRNFTKRAIRVNDLELNSFFPHIKFLSLSYSSLDFEQFSLTSLQELNCVDLSYTSFKNLFKSLPKSVEGIKVSFSHQYCNLNFIENAFDKKIIVDTSCPFKYGKINCAKALSVFSSLKFDMNQTNDEMSAIKEYAQSIEGDIKTVTNVRFDMVFNYKSVANMITLLTCFPNLDDVEVYLNGDCDASINDDQIYQLFSELQLKSVKKLSIHFYQEKETSAFYCFIVELMKRCQEISTLEFYYSKSNSFAINIKRMIERENIKFTNLDNFIVFYWLGNMDISIVLFYVAMYNIKNLKIIMHESIQNLDGLNQVECLKVDNLTINIPSSSNCENLINKIFAKFPHLTNFKYSSENLISIIAMQHMLRLKDVNVNVIVSSNDFSKLLLQLPHNLESLEIRCYSDEMEEIKKKFYERFPGITLTLNVHTK